MFKIRKIAWILVPGIIMGGGGAKVWSAPASPTSAADPAASPVSAPSVLYGNVRSSKDKSPLSGVPIRLENVGAGVLIQKETDSQGSYIFSNLPPGDYKIRVGGGRFSVSRKEGLVKGGMVGLMDFMVNPLSQGSSEILGSVYEGHGDKKIPLAARVAIKNEKTKEVYQVVSDSSGHFRGLAKIT